MNNIKFFFKQTFKCFCDILMLISIFVACIVVPVGLLGLAITSFASGEILAGTFISLGTIFYFSGVNVALNWSEYKYKKNSPMPPSDYPCTSSKQEN